MLQHAGVEVHSTSSNSQNCRAQKFRDVIEHCGLHERVLDHSIRDLFVIWNTRLRIQMQGAGVSVYGRTWFKLCLALAYCGVMGYRLGGSSEVLRRVALPRLQAKADWGPRFPCVYWQLWL